MHIKIRRLLYEMTNTVVERCSEAAPDIEASVLISDEDCEDTILETGNLQCQQLLIIGRPIVAAFFVFLYRI